MLDGVSIDATDGLGMTPLAWAVARNNLPVVALLIEAGANPWAGRQARYGTAVYWAAELGRAELFDRLSRLPGRDFSRWPVVYLQAALEGGNQTIVEKLAAEPHDQFRIEGLDTPLPSATLFAPLLRNDASLANALLLKASDYEPRADLVRLALANGADPNVVQLRSAGETPLGLAARGIGEDTVEVVNLLLRSGADPNRLSHWRRPVGIAVTTLRLDGEFSDVDTNALAIYRRLVAAGADPNGADDLGRPLVWGLLYPYRHSPEQLDASFVTPRLLRTLARYGMDVNAAWNGQRILPLVEAQAGADSELARALRHLGARR